MPRCPFRIVCIVVEFVVVVHDFRSTTPPAWNDSAFVVERIR
jgi:hypothetical protein